MVPVLLLLAAIEFSGCGKNPSAPSAGSVDPAGIPIYTYEVVNVYPHDRGAFTEGLSCLQGGLLESTGLKGASTLRKVDLKTGRVLQEVKLPSEYFGEGPPPSMAGYFNSRGKSRRASFTTSKPLRRRRSFPTAVKGGDSRRTGGR